MADFKFSEERKSNRSGRQLASHALHNVGQFAPCHPSAPKKKGCVGQRDSILVVEDTGAGKDHCARVHNSLYHMFTEHGSQRSGIEETGNISHWFNYCETVLFEQDFFCVGFCRFQRGTSYVLVPFAKISNLSLEVSHYHSTKSSSTALNP